ncbi:hypothetical protein J7426_14340 [Tropicibacter sp. R16_0]|uniref:hypothetical protein n=1 Tax=Tropicibacter sp. R16_0 TaxID=2821102 RepID=UPI001AD99B42|nr:hypothetical protein [Tropicibacter sp. R16_0]MBO9451449.1 hypothetical protein [Tropicibacter sp. R16_0]
MSQSPKTKFVFLTELHRFDLNKTESRTFPAGWTGEVAADIAKSIDAADKGLVADTAEELKSLKEGKKPAKRTRKAAAKTNSQAKQKTATKSNTAKVPNSDNANGGDPSETPGAGDPGGQTGDGKDGTNGSEPSGSTGAGDPGSQAGNGATDPDGTAGNDTVTATE